MVYCKNININACLNSNSDIKKIEMGKIIGQGSFGEVTEGVLTLKDSSKIDCAVKKIFFEEDSINDIFMETDLGIRLGNDGLAPNIYYSFYQNSLTNDGYDGYIIMEKMKDNCHNLLKLNKYNNEDTCNKMIDIYYQLIFDYGIYCFDIKPRNFMYTDNPLTIKMIDFDGSFCKLDEDNKLVEILGSIDIYKNVCFLIGTLVFLKNIDFKYNFRSNNVSSKLLTSFEYLGDLFKILKKENEDCFELYLLLGYYHTNINVISTLLSFYLSFYCDGFFIDYLKEFPQIIKFIYNSETNDNTKIIEEETFQFDQNKITTSEITIDENLGEDVNKTISSLVYRHNLSENRIGQYIYSIICVRNKNENKFTFYVVMEKLNLDDKLYQLMKNDNKFLNNDLIDEIINKLYLEIFENNVFFANLKISNIYLPKDTIFSEVIFTDFRPNFMIDDHFSNNRYKNVYLIIGLIIFFETIPGEVRYTLNYDFKNKHLIRAKEYSQDFFNYIKNVDNDITFLLNSYIDNNKNPSKLTEDYLMTKYRNFFLF